MGVYNEEGYAVDGDKPDGLEGYIAELDTAIDSLRSSVTDLCTTLKPISIPRDSSEGPKEAASSTRLLQSPAVERIMRLIGDVQDIRSHIIEINRDVEL